MSYNQAIAHKLQKVSWCEVVGILFRKLLKKLECNTTLISELSQHVGVHFIPKFVGITFMSELVMVLDQLRDLVEKQLWIDKHNVW